MHRKFSRSFLTFSAFLLLLITPTPAVAVCENAVVANSIGLYECKFSVPVSCNPNPSDITHPFMCCSTPGECAAANASRDPFCNGQVGTIRTALGCINASDPEALVSQIARWTIGIAAGAALVTIAYSGFLITTASGDVKRINEAKTFLMSALLGLLLISISMLILNFVGVKLFGLNNVGFSL